MALRGNAGFRYQSPSGMVVTLPLNAPIRDIHPAIEKTRYARRSEDKTVVDVTTVGGGIHEIDCLIRFEPSVPLEAMLEHAADGTEITYYPELDATESYPCRLIHAGDRLTLAPDRERPYGEYLIRIRLARLDGGNFDGLTATYLSRWVAGSDEGMQLTRSAAALELSRHGILQEAGENILRTNWRINPVSGRLEPFAPLEPERTNVLHGSNLTNGTSDDWTGGTDFTVTEVASIFDGQSAWWHENGGAAGSRQRSQIRGTLGSTPETASTVLENVDAELSFVGIYDHTVADWVVRGGYDWGSGIFTIHNSGAGSDVSIRPEVLRDIGPNGGKVVRLEVTGTSNNPGNARRVIIYPSGISTNTETAIIHHAQHEVGASASSPIVTPTGAPATRAGDILTRAAPPAGMTLVGYHSFITRGTEVEIGGRFFHVGSGDDTNRVFLNRTTSAGLVPQIRLGAGGTHAFASATTAPERGDFVEHIPVLEYDGTQARVRLVQAINGALSGSSAWSAYIDATALIESGWQSDALYVNSRDGGVNPGAQEARALYWFRRRQIRSPLFGADDRLYREIGRKVAA